MKRFLLALVLSTGFYAAQAQQTFTIGFSGNYTPAIQTITEGDTVLFNVTASHPVREVSQATWNANGSTSNGGFTATNGQKVKFNTAGTYYYVCTVHFGSGIKGQIVVNPAATSVNNNEKNVSVSAYPNPVIENATINLSLIKSENLSIEVYNLIGENVYSIPSTTYVSGKNNININFSEFTKGVYFIKIVGKNEEFSLKIIK